MSNVDGEKLDRDNFRKLLFWGNITIRVLSQVQKVLRTFGTSGEVDAKTMRSAKKWFFQVYGFPL
mgnify:CR=1 FL=1